MHTLTYPVGWELSTFTRTNQLVVALPAAIKFLVLLLVTLKYNPQTVIGHHFTFNSGVLLKSEIHSYVWSECRLLFSQF
jgi:hypothetical protein